MTDQDQSLNTLHITHQSGVYDVHIGSGILPRLPELLPDILKSRRFMIVSDKRVAPIYLPSVTSVLHSAGIQTLPPFLFAPGEKSKSLLTLTRLLQHMSHSGLSRTDCVLGLGGGVTGDLAGFAAAIFMRGVPFALVPTTLLAQADSSIGGKTAVNLPSGKNLIGAFHAPSLVLSDLNVLDTLSTRHMRNGLSEIIKMAVIGDSSLFEFLEKHAESIVKPPGRAHLMNALIAACRLKSSIVEQDEKESGIRIQLNLGHTFAHAFECVAGYGKLLHGEAVSLGLLAATRLAIDLGICPPSLLERITALLQRCRLPIRLPPMDIQAVADVMTRDKKSQSGSMSLVLPQQIGRVVVVKNIDPTSLTKNFEHAGMTGFFHLLIK